MLNRRGVIFGLFAIVVVLAAIGAKPDQQGISGPVIFDGQEYSGAEFGDIQRRLAAKGQYMILTPGPNDEILAFSSEESFNAYRVANGLEPESLYPPEVAKRSGQVIKFEDGVLVTSGPEATQLQSDALSPASPGG